MMLLQRVAGAHAVLVVFYLAQEAFALQVLQHLGPAVVLVQPLVTLPGLLGHVACAVHDLNRVQVVFCGPSSKSFMSWAGVTLRQPVPNSLLT